MVCMMDLNEFLALWESARDDPVRVIELFLRAILVCEKDRELGEQMISYLLHPDRCDKDPNSPSGYRPNRIGVGFYIDQLLRRPEIVRSYLGGTPENDYRIDESNIKVEVVSVEKKNDVARVVIRSSGKDFPTPIILKYVDGAWRIYEGISSLATGVRKS